MSASSPKFSQGIWLALRRFTALPAARRTISIEAVVALGVARALILTVPMRWISRRLERQAAGARPSPRVEREVIREVGWAVRAAAPKTPWKSACLAQSLAGKWMLRRRGVDGVIRLAVAKDADGKLHAHAWLCAGDAVLTTADPAHRFTYVGDLD